MDVRIINFPFMLGCSFHSCYNLFFSAEAPEPAGLEATADSGFGCTCDRCPLCPIRSESSCVRNQPDIADFSVSSPIRASSH